MGRHRGFGSITGACSGSVADQQHDEVGHLFGLGEPPRHRAGGGLFGDIPGFAASGPGDRRGDAVLTNPQQGGDWPGLTVLTRMPRGPVVLERSHI